MTSSMGLTENDVIGARPKHALNSEYPPPSQRVPDSVRKTQSPIEHRVVLPVSTGNILGEWLPYSLK